MEQIQNMEITLTSTKLGTKEHWNSVYSEELNNYRESGNIGEPWYGAEGEERIIKWFRSCGLDIHAHILDMGCGNASLLIDLGKEGYLNLVGIDYSEPAIEVAKEIARKNSIDIDFQCCDILKPLDPNNDFLSADNYDVIIDKGTYDAISLMDGTHHRIAYISTLRHLLTKSSGRVIITSCNWTQDELVEHFKSHFKLSDIINTSTFSFGGSQGKKETVCIFERV